MLPLFVFCIRWGFGRGLLVCTALGLLQVFVQGAVSYGWISILLDYIVAFMPLCLCGLGKGKPGGLFWGSVLGSVGRFVIHFISGITVYRILEPTGLMGMTFSNPYLYSAVYNGSYIGPLPDRFWPVLQDGEKVLSGRGYLLRKFSDSQCILKNIVKNMENCLYAILHIFY